MGIGVSSTAVEPQQLTPSDAETGHLHHLLTSHAICPLLGGLGAQLRLAGRLFSGSERPLSGGQQACGRGPKGRVH